MSDMYDYLDFVRDIDEGERDYVDFVCSLENFLNTRGFLSTKQINALINVAPKYGKIIGDLVYKKQLVAKPLWNKAAQEASAEYGCYLEDSMVWGS